MDHVTENYLAHYGVKGMRWGRRRSGDDSSSSSSSSAEAAVATTTAVKKPRKVAGKTETEDGKDISRMSDKELRERINRINMEQQYSKLTEPSYPPVKNGMDVANDIFSTIGKVNQAIAIYNSPAGKIARGVIKKQFDNRRSNTHGIAA